MIAGLNQQCVVIARLADFCRYGSAVSSYESDPWLYMRSKLQETEGPLRELKHASLLSARERFLKQLGEGAPSEQALGTLKEALDRYLSRGDFVDACFHLTPENLADPRRLRDATAMLESLKVHSLFDEEAKPEEKRSPAHQKLVGELYGRLRLDVFERVLSRKPVTPLRKKRVLRRMRVNVAEYCSILHLPSSPDDTFSPFLLSKVEALVVACLRLLNRFR